MKICVTCKEDKSVADFAINKRNRDKLQNECRQCVSARDKRRTKDKDKHMNSMLKYFHGITLEQYMDLSKQQDGMCAICKKPSGPGRTRRLAVDHCHETGWIRGLLCGPCNTALGLFGHDIDTLKAAIEYLEDV